MLQVLRSTRARKNSVREKWTETGIKCRALLLPALPPSWGGRQEPHHPVQSSTDQPVLTAPFLGPTTPQVHHHALKGPRGKPPRLPQRALTTLLRGDVGALMWGSLGPCLAMLGVVLLTREENDLNPTCHPAEGSPHPSFGCTAHSCLPRSPAEPCCCADSSSANPGSTHQKGRWCPVSPSWHV